MDRKLETEDAQNQISRIEKSIYLNVDNPPAHVKRQFAIVKKHIISLHTELDLLNDQKEVLLK